MLNHFEAIAVLSPNVIRVRDRESGTLMLVHKGPFDAETVRRWEQTGLVSGRVSEGGVEYILTGDNFEALFASSAMAAKPAPAVPDAAAQDSLAATRVHRIAPDAAGAAGLRNVSAQAAGTAPQASAQTAASHPAWGDDGLAATRAFRAPDLAAVPQQAPLAGDPMATRVVRAPGAGDDPMATKVVRAPSFDNKPAPSDPIAATRVMQAPQSLGTAQPSANPAIGGPKPTLGGSTPMPAAGSLTEMFRRPQVASPEDSAPSAAAGGSTRMFKAPGRFESDAPPLNPAIRPEPPRATAPTPNDSVDSFQGGSARTTRPVTAIPAAEPVAKAKKSPILMIAAAVIGLAVICVAAYILFGR